MSAIDQPQPDLRGGAGPGSQLRAWLLAGGRAAAAATGGLVLVALGVALLPHRPGAVVVVVGGIGVLGVLALAGPALWRRARRHPVGSAVSLVVGALVLAWLIVGLERTGARAWPTSVAPLLNFRSPYAVTREFRGAPSLPSWPWRIGRVPVLPLGAMILSAGGGVVLISDAVRLYIGIGNQTRTPWRLVTSARSRSSQMTWLAVPGAALVAVATVLAVSLASRYTSNDPGLEALAILAIVSWSAFLLGSPLIVGVAMRVDLDQAGKAREEERQRFAAHLHDSVLQTLALIQRQAYDPAAVSRLARRQEHALRAWMAGESDLNGNTVATAVREVVAEVEDEAEVVIQLTTIGDGPIDQRAEALVAAAREVLRNAARHAAGSPVFVFLDVTAERAELFIRDEGPGFDPDTIPPERRGLRDAVLGRMVLAGGQATIDSSIGEGTEVALRIPHEVR